MAEILTDEVGRVLRECGKGQPMTSREIYAKCELPEQVDQVSRALHNLLRSGKVERMKTGDRNKNGWRWNFAAELPDFPDPDVPADDPEKPALARQPQSNTVEAAADAPMHPTPQPPTRTACTRFAYSSDGTLTIMRDSHVAAVLEEDEWGDLVRFLASIGKAE